MQAVEVVAIQVVTEGTAHPWTEAMHPLIAMVVLTEVIHLTVDMGTGTTLSCFLGLSFRVSSVCKHYIIWCNWQIMLSRAPGPSCSKHG